MWITYNAVCIIIHQGLENVETFSPRPRLFLQDQDQDFYFKTKTKTICHVLEAPRDQDQGLETTSLHPTTLSGYIFATMYRQSEKNLLSSNISPTCPTIW